jgi:hypothetical protein
MAVIEGFGGQSVFGGGALMVLKKWDIDDQANMEDVTGMSTGSVGRKEFDNTLSEWSGTLEGDIDTTDAKFHGATPAIRAGAKGAASFAAGTRTWSGNIIIKSLKVSAPVEGVLSYNIGFQGSGLLTYPA